MLLQADAASIPLPDKSIHCVCCSPPYWGLRRYQGEQGRGMFPNLGLEPTPELHIEYMVEIFRDVKRVLRDDGTVWLNYGDCYAGSGGHSPDSPASQPDAVKARGGFGSMLDGRLIKGTNYTTPTLKAGNLMLMPHRVAIALQEDGAADPKAMRVIQQVISRLENAYDTWDAVPEKVKAQIEELEHEYQDARSGGWIVRNDAVWWKRNPMPEAVKGWRWEQTEKCDCWEYRYDIYEYGLKKGKIGMGGDVGGKVNPSALADKNCPKCHGTGKVGDPVLRKGSWRHTRAHEYVFQLVKGPKMNYYSNQEAVREVADPQGMKMPDGWDTGDGAHGNIHRDGREKGQYTGKINAGRNPRSVLDDSTPALESFRYWLMENYGFNLDEAIEIFKQMMTNPDDVLDVPTAPYSGAHYATFPPNLIAPLIRASCPKRCCPECGAPWAPVVEQSYFNDTTTDGRPAVGNYRKGGDQKTFASGERTRLISNVTDFRPTCSHNHDHIPGIVLDPFIGSGTTGAVARELGRRWVGLDISMEYLDQQAKIRALNWTPSNALDGLPLFKGLPDEL